MKKANRSKEPFINPVCRVLPFRSTDTAHKPKVLKLLAAHPAAVLLSNMLGYAMVREIMAEYGLNCPPLPPGETFSLTKGKKVLGQTLCDWISNECEKL